MYDYGYVSALFHQKDINYFSDLIKNICKKIDLYGEKGDVTKKLHLTLLYGIIENMKVKKEIEEYVSKIDLEEIQLGVLGLFSIPNNNKFKILYVEVIDQDKTLSKIHKELKMFPYEKSVQHDPFVAHLALAYVIPDFKIPSVDIRPCIKVKSTEYFEINP